MVRYLVAGNPSIIDKYLLAGKHELQDNGYEENRSQAGGLFPTESAAGKARHLHKYRQADILPDQGYCIWDCRRGEEALRKIFLGMSLLGIKILEVCRPARLKVLLGEVQMILF